MSVWEMFLMKPGTLYAFWTLVLLVNLLVVFHVDDLRSRIAEKDVEIARLREALDESVRERDGDETAGAD